jgi:antitoxin MazE
MGTQSHIAHWGSSLAVRIPKPLAEEWGVRAGSAIEITTDGERLTLTKRTYDLDELLSRVTTDNLHSEWDTGSAQSKEVE